MCGAAILYQFLCKKNTYITHAPKFYFRTNHLGPFPLSTVAAAKFHPLCSLSVTMVILALKILNNISSIID